MKFLANLCVFVLIFSISISNVAYAYLDPGSVSLAVQAFVAAFAGVALTWKLWWSKVKGWFGKLCYFLGLNRKKLSPSNDLEFETQVSNDDPDNTTSV